MSLPSLSLDAFLAVAQTAGFSSAAKQLGLTQSALSQRIKNLEEELGLTLFVRSPSGAHLTEQGERLLRYCQTRNSLEEELVQDLRAPQQRGKLMGTVRIGAHSSVLRSVVIPALSPLLEASEGVLCEFVCAPGEVLPGLLQRAEVDFVVMDSPMNRAHIEAVKLGEERYVIIEPKKKSRHSDVFLDNSPLDLATEFFFKSQGGKIPRYRRSYFWDCYGIMDGVRAGLGKAVMPRHLLADQRGIQVAKGGKGYSMDVLLHYYHQPFYSELHRAVVKQLTENAGKYLG